MKTCIIALNSQYIHAALAPWYLKAACGPDADIEVLEYTINQTVAHITAGIAAVSPDAAAFSCYIFNVDWCIAVARRLKLIFPNIILLFGGPEVSFDAAAFLTAHPFVDGVVSGPGEQAFALFASGASFETIPGLSFRSGAEIVVNPESSHIPLADTASPYTREMLAAAKGRILYYESSRGCPFSCSYCLSSAVSGVEYLPMERVKRELLQISASGVRQIKFVDRTFNAHLPRAKEIISFIRSECAHLGKNYHFEVAADLFDDETIALLSAAPPGLFQLEIGIQSFNTDTLSQVCRRCDLSAAEENIRRLLHAGNVHIHCDLIAGLPCEDFTSFSRSCNRLFALKPHQLQIGFLKLLKGSALRKQSEPLGLVFDPARACIRSRSALRGAAYR